LLQQQKTEQLDTSPCCSMTMRELSIQEDICHSCLLQLEAEAEDLALEGALQDYRDRRFGSYDD